MMAILVWWAIYAALMLALAAFLGYLITKNPLGILMDNRGRYSLTHLQLCLWTVVLLSLLAGAFTGRLQHGADNPLNFVIPPEVLGVLGISAGSAVLSSVAKAAKDVTSAREVAASLGRRDEALRQRLENDASMRKPEAGQLSVGESQETPAWKPRFVQIFMQEEGAFADRAVNITKFQQFMITVVLIAAYITLGVQSVRAAGTASGFTSLPGFAGTFVTLLALSHGAYIAGKLPPAAGEPEFSLAERNALRRVGDVVVSSNSAQGTPLGGPAAPGAPGRNACPSEGA